VWLVDPTEKNVTEYRSMTAIKQYSGDDVISAEPVLPGFSCPISRFFQGVKETEPSIPSPNRRYP
jgi:Uma2 family endonuclease